MAFMGVVGGLTSGLVPAGAPDLVRVVSGVAGGAVIGFAWNGLTGKPVDPSGATKAGISGVCSLFKDPKYAAFCNVLYGLGG
ncbi:MAG TPA: hypothetical protein VF337_01255, partial [Candidatus Limnocylindrales bacterium]